MKRIRGRCRFFRKGGGGIMAQKNFGTCHLWGQGGRSKGDVPPWTVHFLPEAPTQRALYLQKNKEGGRHMPPVPPSETAPDNNQTYKSIVKADLQKQDSILMKFKIQNFLTRIASPMGENALDTTTVYQSSGHDWNMWANSFGNPIDITHRMPKY